MSEKQIKIALIGNPNCGKTTMFNALTGSNQYVGNWPGVTVEKKEGKYKKDKNVTITDLPGIYSLSPYTLEEVVSRDYLVKDHPDAIIDLVDATNLERNLYLTTQVTELGIPVVMALNMIDVSRKKGDKIDTERLGKSLGVQVIETSALHEEGLDEVVEAAIKVANNPAAHNAVESRVLGDDVEEAVAAIENVIPDGTVEPTLKRWYSIKLLERDEKIQDQLKLPQNVMDSIEKTASDLEKDLDNDTESIITDARYDYIARVVKGSYHKAGQGMSTSDKIDQIVTNRWLGIPIFVLIMFGVYYLAVGTFGTAITDWTNDTLFGTWILPSVQSWMEGIGAAGWLTDMVVNGILNGIGSVLGFVPQMAVMFLLLSILEDVGYMARVAFVMDRIFRHFGLSGKSFIPILISSGCGVPGILATKTIENDNDRRLTAMVCTYVPCGAKLEPIALITGVLAGAWWVSPIIYFIGIATILISAIMLKKTKWFHGQSAPFVMELPAYHIPSPKTVLMHVWERLWAYLKKVGTILWVACMVMWFLSTYGFGPHGFGMVDQEYSLIAYLGKALAWIFIPLGFGTWQAIASTISGFVAKESIVSTMQILTSANDQAKNYYTQIATMFPSGQLLGISAFSFLVFNMLNSPCLAAISTLAREMNDKRWTTFALVFQNVNAYLITLMIYQFGKLIMYGSFTGGTVAAFVVLVIYLYFIFRKDKYVGMEYQVRRSVDVQ